ncbi:hypothetical protein R5R35_006494 [Gryllus longicercus]|uniref:Ankyrin repeat protein n=1 Tax=Gryllus longicercus TaxID=2509291 RepID=A0AAN9Z574_9ORTH
MYSVAIPFLCVVLHNLVGAQPVSLYVPDASETEALLKEAIDSKDAALFFFIHKHCPDALKNVDLDAALFKVHPQPMFVRGLLALGANVSTRNSEGETLLHLVARGSPFSVLLITELLLAGAEVDALTYKGDTPLMSAIVSDQASITYELLKAGADRKKTTAFANSLVLWTIKNRKRIAPILFGLKALSSDNYCESSLKLEIDFQSSFLDYISNSTDSLLRTNIHKSCFSLQFRSWTIDDVEAMLNQRDLLNRTPLHTAVLRNDMKCVENLLDAGADAEVVDWLNRTPRQIAKFCGYVNIENIFKSYVNQSKVLQQPLPTPT